MNEYYQNLIFYRRKFRQIPELCFLEMQTTIELIKLLKPMAVRLTYGRSIHGHRSGLPSESAMREHAKTLDLSGVDFDIEEIKRGYTGLIVDIDTEKHGPKIAFRFDIDALSIQETSDYHHLPNQLEFRSRNKGMCHACAHDGHIAMGIVLCQYLVEHKDSLRGSYRIIFQPAEEGVHGGRSMTEKGCTDQVDYMIGSHIGLNESANVIGVGTEGFLSTKKFDVTYWGRAAHAANNPEYGRNALLGAASLCLSLNGLIQYSTSNTKLNIGFLRAGTMRNIIPQDSVLEGEVRADHYTTLKDLWERVVHAIQGNALTYGLQYRLDETGESIDFLTKYPEFVDFINEKLQEKGFQTHLRPQLLGSEDVTYMFKKVEDDGGKGIHFLIGAKLKAPHHNEGFDFNEDAMFLGLNLFIEVIDIILGLNES